jgi:hypothetical protein
VSIHKLLSAVSADIGAIGKDRKNAAQGFNYRGIDDLVNAAHPAFVKNGVVVVPKYEQVGQTEERTTGAGKSLYVIRLAGTFTFYAPDGSNVVAGPFIGEGSDSGDKACNKAMSAAFKYALTQTLCIPFMEQDDSDKDTPEPSTRAPARQAPQSAAPTGKKLVELPKWNDPLICGEDNGRHVRAQVESMTKDQAEFAFQYYNAVSNKTGQHQDYVLAGREACKLIREMCEVRFKDARLPPF